MVFLPSFKLRIGFITGCLFLSSYFSSITAQKSIENSLDLNFGISNFHIADDLASPVFFRGTGMAPSIRFTQVRLKSIHQLEGAYYHNNLSSKADNFNTENFKAGFHYSYYARVIKGQVLQRRFTIYAGGSVTSFFSKSDYYFDLQTIQARTLSSWYWSHSLDVAAMADYHPSDRSLLRFQVQMPVLSNVSRPTYSSMGDYDLETNDWVIKTFGKNCFFPENSSVSTLLLYRQQVMNHLYMQLGWEFYYVQYKDPMVIKMYMNNFRLGAGFNF